MQKNAKSEEINKILRTICWLAPGHLLPVSLVAEINQIPTAKAVATLEALIRENYLDVSDGGFFINAEISSLFRLFSNTEYRENVVSALEKTVDEILENDQGEEFFRYLPHIKFVLSEAVNYPPDEKTARLHNYVGRYFHEKGDLDNAQAHFEAAIEIDEALFGRRDPVLILNLWALGNVLVNQARLDEANAMFLRALSIAEDQEEIDTDTIALIQNELGSLHVEMQEYEAAKDYYEASVMLHEIVHGEDHHNTGLILHNLGTLYQKIGDLEAASRVFERIIRIEEKHYGEQHKIIADLMIYLGNIYAEMRKYDDAQRLYQKALKIFLAQYPQDEDMIRLIKKYLKN